MALHPRMPSENNACSVAHKISTLTGKTEKDVAMLWCWVANYLLTSLFFKWILSWGGAERIEGWKAFFLVHWLAGTWEAEQIRFWALLMWIIVSLGFLWGLFVPDVREFLYNLKGLRMIWFFCPKE